MNTVSQAEYVAQTNAAYETSGAKKKPANYGRTIGNPQLSEEGQKYYEELKKKYSNMDFILVSKDMKETAKAQAGSYANPNRLVVLVDEEKIERMATDENFRRQYEGIIANAAVKLPQMQKSVGSNPAVKGFGMQINDGGNASLLLWWINPWQCRGNESRRTGRKRRKRRRLRLRRMPKRRLRKS